MSIEHEKLESVSSNQVTKKRYKRDRRDIIYDILRYLLENGQRGRNTKTKICYMSQMPYELFKPLFKTLLEKDIITLESTQNLKGGEEMHMYKITQLGNVYIQKYEELMGMLNWSLNIK